MVSCEQLDWFLGQLVHQTGPQFECLSLPRRRKGASYPIDSHLCAQADSPARPLLLRRERM
jgi:hypothetical protein